MQKDIAWAQETLVLELHEFLIRKFGGASGVREAGLLLSALARPKNMAAYGAGSLFAMAAAYATGIIKNHPFIDGNKRTGFMVAYTFLGANGQQLLAEEAEATVMTLALAAGELSEEQFTQWLSDNCKPVKT